MTNLPSKPDTLSPADQLRARLKADLRAAMTARASIAVTTLRTLMGAVDNAEAVPMPETNSATPPVVGRAADVPRRLLTWQELRTILEREAEERRRNIEQYEQLGKKEFAAQIREELEVVQRCLAGIDELSAD